MTEDDYKDIRYIVGIARNRFEFEWGNWYDRSLTASLVEAINAGVDKEALRVEAKLAPSHWQLRTNIHAMTDGLEHD